MTILAFIFGVVITLFALGSVTYYNYIQLKNKLHFYVARDKDQTLWLYLCKPIKEDECFRHNIYGGVISHSCNFKDLGMNIDDYKDLKWEDEPVEVFLRLEYLSMRYTYCKSCWWWKRIPIHVAKPDIGICCHWRNKKKSSSYFFPESLKRVEVDNVKKFEDWIKT